MAPVRPCGRAGATFVVSATRPGCRAVADHPVIRRTQPVTLSGVTIPRRLALATASVALAALAGCSGHAAATPTASAVPVVSNIPRPNAACVPADKQTLNAAGNDLNERLMFGYIDGEQKELLLGKAMEQQLNGHKVEYAWVCPLRSQWK